MSASIRHAGPWDAPGHDHPALNAINTTRPAAVPARGVSSSTYARLHTLPPLRDGSSLSPDEGRESG